MAAHDNITFTASNGVGVGFRCSYRGVSYMNFQVVRGGLIIEGEDHNDGQGIRPFLSVSQEKITQAYAEYNDNEARKFEEWKKQNARLFA